MVHVEDSLISRGLQNLECVVLPPGINNAAMPDEAIVRTISLADLIVVDMALHIKVLPVPPYP